MKRARRPSAWEDVAGGGDGAAAADGDAADGDAPAAAAPDAAAPDAPEPDAPEPSPKQAPKKATQASSKSSGKSVAWTCAACTFENWRGKKCGACGSEKPAAAGATEAAGAPPPPPTPTPLPALSFRVGGDGVKRSGSPDRRKNKSPFAAEAPSPDRGGRGGGRGGRGARGGGRGGRGAPAAAPAPPPPAEPADDPFAARDRRVLGLPRQEGWRCTKCDAANAVARVSCVACGDVRADVRQRQVELYAARGRRRSRSPSPRRDDTRGLSNSSSSSGGDDAPRGDGYDHRARLQLSSLADHRRGGAGSVRAFSADELAQASRTRDRAREADARRARRRRSRSRGSRRGGSSGSSSGSSSSSSSDGSRSRGRRGRPRHAAPFKKMPSRGDGFFLSHG
jgi:hypothetical protein